MGGITGYFNRDGMPAHAELLSTMLASTPHRGPDGTVAWVEGCVAMGQHIMKTLPEPGAELPFRDDAAGLKVTLNGRIDNLAELSGLLAARGHPLVSGSDAECILRAYQAWGENCAVHLIGEFAFALFDARNQRLVLCRDALGVRSLYYAVDGKRIRWGSELRHVLADDSVPRKRNEGMVAEYLADEITSRTETLWESVLRLPAAHVMLVDASGMRARRYWEPNLELLRYSSDDAYAEHFRQVFTEAVRCRLRAVGPVACDLSGGLDSSSILCVANSLADAGQGAPDGLEAYTLDFAGYPEADESEFSDAVIALTGVRQVKVAPFEPPPSYYAEEARRTLDFPSAPNGAMHVSQFALARERGSRVRLCGSGGDQWLTGSRAMYADYFRHGKARSSWRELRAAGRRWGWRDSLNDLVRGGILPSLPRPAYRILRDHFGGSALPDWMLAGFADAVGLRERIQAETGNEASCESAAQRSRYSFLHKGFEAYVFEWDERTSAAQGLETRLPFYDRRLVEFTLRLPVEQLCRSTTQKVVLRRSLEPYFPPIVGTRQTKSHFSHVSVSAIESGAGSSLVAESAHLLGSLVSAGRLVQMAAETAGRYKRDDPTYVEFIHPIWQVIAMAMWMTATEGPLLVGQSGENGYDP